MSFFREFVIILLTEVFCGVMINIIIPRMLLESTRLKAEESLENPYRVPKVQSESRISQAKGQSRHSLLGRSVPYFPELLLK